MLFLAMKSLLRHSLARLLPGVLVLLLPVTVLASCGADYCSCYGYTTGTDCSGDECWCYCSSGETYRIDDEGDCSGLGAGAIAGIVVGSLALLGIAVGGTVLLVCCCKKRNARNTSASSGG